jgi:hypothetical protein
MLNYQRVFPFKCGTLEHVDNVGISRVPAREAMYPELQAAGDPTGRLCPKICQIGDMGTTKYRKATIHCGKSVKNHHLVI